MQNLLQTGYNRITDRMHIKTAVCDIHTNLRASMDEERGGEMKSERVCVVAMDCMEIACCVEVPDAASTRARNSSNTKSKATKKTMKGKTLQQDPSPRFHPGNTARL